MRRAGGEGEVGRFRRTHLVPVPASASLAALNAYLAGCCAADDDRVIARRRHTVGAAFAAEQPALQPLPDEGFDAAALLTCTADAKARISVRGAWYSVPASLARRKPTVRLHAEHLEVLRPGSDAIVAAHSRSLHKNTQTLQLDHYPGDPVPQAWRPARLDRAGPGPRRRGVQRAARGVPDPPGPARGRITGMWFWVPAR